MALCWRHRVAMPLLVVCTLCLGELLLAAATQLLPVIVRHMALVVIGNKAYLTVAECATSGSVTVPRYPMLWLIATAALCPLDQLMSGCDTVYEDTYWEIKIYVMAVLRIVWLMGNNLRLERAVAHIQLPTALRYVDGDRSVPLWCILRHLQPGVMVTYREQSAQPILQFFVDHAQVLDQVMKTMRLHVYTETLPATLFQSQWSSLRSLTIHSAPGWCTIHPSTMNALIRATPNLYELTMIGCNTGPQSAAVWALTDGWSKVHKVRMNRCNRELCNCVILQTRRLTEATFSYIPTHMNANPPVLPEFVRRNGGTLTHFTTNSFGMDELELLTQCRRLQHIFVDCTGAHWAAYTRRRVATIIQTIVSLRVVALSVPRMPRNTALAPGSLSHITTLLLNSVIPRQAVHSILQAAPNLHILRLVWVRGGIDSGTLHSIVTSVPQLRRLYLANIKTLNDDVLRTIALALPQLTHLRLGYSSITDEDSGDAGRWATVDSVPQRMLPRIKLIRLDRTRAHTQAELESVERLRTALRALAGRTHGVLDRAVVMLDNTPLRHANDTCDFYQWPPPLRMYNDHVMLPRESLNMNTLLW